MTNPDNSADPRVPQVEPPAKQALLRAYNRELKSLESAPPVSLEIGRMELVCLISALQLALRHPRYNGASSKVVRDVIRQIEESAFEGFPATKAVIKRGWDRAYDDIIPPGS